MLGLLKSLLPRKTRKPVRVIRAFAPSIPQVLSTPVIARNDCVLPLADMTACKRVTKQSRNLTYKNGLPRSVPSLAMTKIARPPSSFTNKKKMASSIQLNQIYTPTPLLNDEQKEWGNAPNKINGLASNRKDY